MAQPREHTFGYEALNSPPSIHGPEVSAEWKRNQKGEIIMTVSMPLDAVDSEVYIKIPRGHSGILMDPWTSSTCRKRWSTYHSPNKVTKDKLNRFNQERTHQCISLYKAAGRQRQLRNSCWSPRPNRKQNPHAFGLIADHPSGTTSARQHKLNKVRQ